MSWRTRKGASSSLQRWWDLGKEKKIKGIIIKHCTQEANDRSKHRSLLINLANHLKSKIDMGQVSLLDVFEAVQARISDIDTAAAKGAQVRSRVQWAEEGETSSRYFMRLEKKRGAENKIPAMKNPDGSIASRITDIGDSWVSFYTNLFTACDTDPQVQSSLLDQLSLTLSPGLAGLCEGNISVCEAFSALKGIARSKSPGSDGLPAEFFQVFWDVLGSDLVEVFNASLVSGRLPLSQRGALITLIFKKGDRLEHKNWRP